MEGDNNVFDSESIISNYAKPNLPHTNAKLAYDFVSVGAIDASYQSVDDELYGHYDHVNFKHGMEDMEDAGKEE
eukprot:Pgem_evm1s16898